MNMRNMLFRATRGCRACRPLPRRGRLLVYHRPDLERQRWHGHV